MTDDHDIEYEVAKRNDTLSGEVASIKTAIIGSAEFSRKGLLQRVHDAEVQITGNSETLTWIVAERKRTRRIVTVVGTLLGAILTTVVAQLLLFYVTGSQ